MKTSTLFFSATLPPELETLTKWILRDPIAIEIGRRQSAADTVAHALYPVAKDQKMELLLAMLEATHFHSVLVFTQTKIAADKVGPVCILLDGPSMRGQPSTQLTRSISMIRRLFTPSLSLDRTRRASTA